MLKYFFINWNIMRVLRLALGLIILVQALLNQDQMLAFFAALFIAMPLFNIGCCSTRTCATIPKKSKTDNTEINFEEIK